MLSIEIMFEISAFSIDDGEEEEEAKELDEEGGSYIDLKYCKVSNISRTLSGNEIVHHSDAIGASPDGAAPATSSFST